MMFYKLLLISVFPKISRKISFLYCGESYANKIRKCLFFLANSHSVIVKFKNKFSFKIFNTVSVARSDFKFRPEEKHLLLNSPRLK